MADEREQTKPAPNNEERSLSGIGGLRPQPPQNNPNSGHEAPSNNSGQGSNSQK